MSAVAVIGGGAWGTALALHLAGIGHEVILWVRDPARAHQLAAERENAAYLPGFPFPDSIAVTADHDAALAEVAWAVVAVPSRGLRGTVGWLGERIPPDTWLVCATKGVEENTGYLMHQVLTEEAGGRIGGVGILSGPSFAQEVAQGLPTAVTLAHPDLDRAEALAEGMRGGHLRVYSSDDPLGVELGGAVKNVIAIAAGIADGLGLGYNARAALITRGLAEMSRLGEAWGGRADTLAGLAGLGDLVLTCTGPLSRNYQLGQVLGGGTPVAEVEPTLWRRAEGVPTARAVAGQARALGVEMPITEQVERILHGGHEPRQAVSSLMHRPPKSES